MYGQYPTELSWDVGVRNANTHAYACMYVVVL